MNKIVLNRSYGGFELSAKAASEYLKLAFPNKKFYAYSTEDYQEYFRINLDTYKGDRFYITSTNQGAITNHIKDEFIIYNIQRHDKNLVKVVELLGDNASGNYANLQVISIPDNKYYITEYDGFESVLTPSTINWNEL